MPKRSEDPLQLSIREYFFEDGDLTKLRKGTVSRAELWAILSWYEKEQRRQRGWKGRLKRAFRNAPTLSPFDWVRSMRR